MDLTLVTIVLLLMYLSFSIASRVKIKNQHDHIIFQKIDFILFLINFTLLGIMGIGINNIAMYYIIFPEVLSFSYNSLMVGYCMLFTPLLFDFVVKNERIFANSNKKSKSKNVSSNPNQLELLDKDGQVNVDMIQDQNKQDQKGNKSKDSSIEHTDSNESKDDKDSKEVNHISKQID